jgi:hypothetical protein
MQWSKSEDSMGRTTYRAVDEDRGITAEVVDVGGAHWWWLSKGPGGQRDGQALAERACEALAEVKEAAA